MKKVANDEKELKQFIKELEDMLAELKYEVELTLYDWNDEFIRFTMVLNNRQQWGKMFKIPNHIYFNLDVEGSELTDMSGEYTDWFLVVPNKM